MSCKDSWHYLSNHPNCNDCPCFMDDCDGDPEVLEDEC